jgi:hypothetical protein
VPASPSPLLSTRSTKKLPFPLKNKGGCEGRLGARGTNEVKEGVGARIHSQNCRKNGWDCSSLQGGSRIGVERLDFVQVREGDCGKRPGEHLQGMDCDSCGCQINGNRIRVEHAADAPCHTVRVFVQPPPLVCFHSISPRSSR